MTSPFDLTTPAGRESEYRRILERLQGAIGRELKKSLGDDVQAFLRAGEESEQGDWASGVWADVDLPSARLLDAGERFVSGEGPRDRVIDMATHVLDAWKKSIQAFQPERESGRAVQR